MGDEQDYYGDKRIILIKLEYNKKQLHKAKEEGNDDKIHKIMSNIKQYQNDLKKLKKGV